MFLAAGLRYFQQKSVRTARGSTPIYTAAEFEDVLASLVPGDHLEVIPELGNDYNPSAQLLFHEEKVVAYLPDWLARLCAPWANGGNALVGKTIRVNEAGAGWHLRLMAVVSAEEPFAEVDTRLRDGEALKYKLAVPVWLIVHRAAPRGFADGVHEELPPPGARDALRGA